MLLVLAKRFLRRRSQRSNAIGAFTLFYCFTLAPLLQLPYLPKASCSFLSFKPLSALNEPQDPTEVPQTSYIPFRSLPKEKFKRLVPYLHYDDDDLLEPLQIPRKYPPPMGRLEEAFPMIGGAFAVGFACGGAYGIVEGFAATFNIRGRVRVTQIFNHFLKRGRYLGNTLGVVALLYCSTGVLFHLARGGKDDAWNTIAAGGVTGLMMESSKGLPRSTKVGIGVALSALHVLVEHVKRVVFG